MTAPVDIQEYALLHPDQVILRFRTNPLSLKDAKAELSLHQKRWNLQLKVLYKTKPTVYYGTANFSPWYTISGDTPDPTTDPVLGY